MSKLSRREFVIALMVGGCFLSPITIQAADKKLKIKTTSEEKNREELRLEAEIHKRFEEENNRPKKIKICDWTEKGLFPYYCEGIKRRIETIGTLNFPQKYGERLYGEVIITIPVMQDGTIYEARGGPSIVQTSGNPALDSAAIHIIRRASPFGRLPKELDKSPGYEVGEIVFKFLFKKEDALTSDSNH